MRYIKTDLGLSSIFITCLLYPEDNEFIKAILLSIESGWEVSAGASVEFVPSARVDCNDLWTRRMVYIILILY